MPSGAVPASFLIINKRGLHARASAKFVQMVERFNAEVWVTRGSETVGGNSIMGLMMLAAGPGTTIVVSAIGPDAAGRRRRHRRARRQQVQRRRYVRRNSYVVPANAGNFPYITRFCDLLIRTLVVDLYLPVKTHSLGVMGFFPRSRARLPLALSGTTARSLLI